MSEQLLLITPPAKKEPRSKRTERRFKKWAEFYWRKNYVRLQANIDFKFPIDLEDNFASIILGDLGFNSWLRNPEATIHGVIENIRAWRKFLNECEIWRAEKRSNPGAENPAPEIEPNCYYWKCNQLVY